MALAFQDLESLKQTSHAKSYTKKLAKRQM